MLENFDFLFLSMIVPFIEKHFEAWELHMQFAHSDIHWVTLTLLGSWKPLQPLHSDVYKLCPPCKTA